MAFSIMAATVTDGVRSMKAKLDFLLHEDSPINVYFEKLEQKTGVKRLYLSIGLITIVALYLMIGYGAQFVCNFIGFLYPAYASIKAIESPQKDDDTKWLTYWVVYSVFSLIEFFADILLFWIPFYWLLKCLFLLWCMIPVDNNGSIVMYYRFIRPFILHHEDRIDKAIDDAKSTISGVKNVAQEALESEAMKKLADEVKID